MGVSIERFPQYSLPWCIFCEADMLRHPHPLALWYPFGPLYGNASNLNLHAIEFP